ncbi:MAG TPA: site-specific integrase, partial [Nitrospiraceae bacterium]|nr:site-specific integrase [Nitrospiraceae bacterium]
KDRRVAGEIFAAWQVQVARAKWLGLPAPTPQHTVQDLLREYAAKVTPRKSPASQRRDHVVLEQFGKRWGTLALDQLRTKTLEDYLSERLQDVTLATVSKELGILKSAYGRALRWDWVTTTPFRGITLNQDGEERVRWLTDAEEGRLVAAASPWLRDLILVGLDTGLRRSNLVGLQWGWLHEHGTVLMVPRQLVKAKKATVMIPLTTRATTIIRQQVRHGNCVFTHSAGCAYSLSQVSMAVIRAAKHAQLTGVSLHTLRHTFISRLVQAGRPLPEVAALAGHRTIMTTMRYAHLAPSHLRAGIQALEQRSPNQQTGHALSTVTLESRYFPENA